MSDALVTIGWIIRDHQRDIAMGVERDVDSIVRALYERPEHRHAVDVRSDEDVGMLRSAIEATIERVYGVEAVWGRGIRVRVERDDEDIPHRLWLWRSLVGGQRTDRDGFSGQQRLVSE